MINETEFKPNMISGRQANINWINANMQGEDIKIELEAKSQSSDKDLEPQNESQHETPVKQNMSSESNLSTPEARMVKTTSCMLAYR